MLRFLRRQKPETENEEKKLKDNFDPHRISTHGVPKDIIRFSFDPTLNYIAIVTRNGLVELYEPSGQKRILLRKLGNTPSFFSFVEGKEALFVVSPEKPGTSHLPEAIHLLDTNGVHPCLTYESGRGSSRFLCYNVVHVPDKGEFLLIGNDNNKINAISWNEKWNSDLEMTPFMDFSDTAECQNKKIKCIKSTKTHLISLFGKDVIITSCIILRKILQKIVLNYDVQSFILNPSSSVVYASSSEAVLTLSLDDLLVNVNGEINNSFLETSYYNVLNTVNGPITIFCGGVPEELSRDTMLTISTKHSNYSFTITDVLLDIQLQYDDRGCGTSLMLLSEHEFIAIDLTDPQFRRVPLKFLNCVDFSAVTCVNVISKKAQLTSLLRLHNEIYSSNNSNFVHNSPDDVNDYIITGHQNGDVVIWRADDYGQQVVCYLRAREYVSLSLPNKDENEVFSCSDNKEFTESIVKVHTFNPEAYEVKVKKNDIRSPTQHFEYSTRAPQALSFYDDRCDEDGYSVEVIKYIPGAEVLLVGLNAGLVFSYSLNENLKWKEASVNVVPCNLSNSNVTSTITARNISLTGALFKPNRHILSLLPSTPIRAMDMSPNTNNIAVGCSTGIVIFDIHNGYIVYSKNFLTPEETNYVISEEKPLTRLKSMKLSVRKTFRSKRSSSRRTRPYIEREIQFRDSTAPASNGFRCIKFMESSTDLDFFLAGTANGVLFLFGISSDTCTLFKELRMANKSPICSIDFWKDPQQQVKVIVFTEEQVRSFCIENMKPSRLSYKITAKHGVKIRKGVVIKKGTFSYLALLCNDNTVMALSMFDKRARLVNKVVDKADIIATRINDLNKKGALVAVTKSATRLKLVHCSRPKTGN